MNGEALRILLSHLEQAYSGEYKEWIQQSRERSPFYILVSTIISQNTTWKNTRKAMERLRRMFSVDPKILSESSPEEVAEAIAPAGLQDAKARSIVSAARRIVEDLDGDLERLRGMPVNEARKWLTSIEGVGPKTADVVLAFAFSKPVLPVDTHIRRIALRLGIVKSSSYERIREALEKLVPPEKRLFAHIALILYGRRTCKAVNPRCEACIVQNLCPSRKS